MREAAVGPFETARNTQMRNIYCRHYDTCLTDAARKNLSELPCKMCVYPRRAGHKKRGRTDLPCPACDSTALSKPPGVLKTEAASIHRLSEKGFSQG